MYVYILHVKICTLLTHSIFEKNFHGQLSRKFLFFKFYTLQATQPTTGIKTLVSINPATNVPPPHLPTSEQSS